MMNGRFTAMIPKPNIKLCSGSMQLFHGPKSTLEFKQFQVNAHCCFYYEDLVHNEYAPKRQTTKKEYYLKVMKGLRKATGKKRPQR